MLRLRLVTCGVLTAGCLLAFNGCGSHDLPVQGNITLDQSPVESGSISFYPEGATGGQPASAPIQNGKYELPPSQDLVPGRYRVEVSWPRSTGRQVPSLDPGIMADETEEAVPAKFNSASELTVEIEPSQRTYDFALASD